MWATALGRVRAQAMCPGWGQALRVSHLPSPAVRALVPGSAPVSHTPFRDHSHCRGEPPQESWCPQEPWGLRTHPLNLPTSQQEKPATRTKCRFWRQTLRTQRHVLLGEGYSALQGGGRAGTLRLQAGTVHGLGMGAGSWAPLGASGGKGVFNNPGYISAVPCPGTGAGSRGPLGPRVQGAQSTPSPVPPPTPCSSPTASAGPRGDLADLRPTATGAAPVPHHASGNPRCLGLPARWKQSLLALLGHLGGVSGQGHVPSPVGCVRRWG